MSYTDELLQSIDMIVSQRVQDVKFDKTIVGTVIEVKDNIYTVEYEAMKLVCYPLNETEYKEKDEVYVLIPQGDFNLRKVITGKVTSKDVPVYLYVNPMTEIERFEYKEQPIPITFKQYPDMPKVKYFAVTADFKCFLDKMPEEPKEYGLKITTSAGIWTFSSKEFQGNPYKFSAPYQQSKVFSVSGDKITIEKAEAFGSEFEYSNLVFSYGWAKEDLLEQSQLALSSPTEFYPNEENKISFNDLKYIINKENAVLPDDCFVIWYKYNQKSEELWDKIKETKDLKAISSYEPNLELVSEKFKAQIVKGEDKEPVLESNTLIVYREDEKEIQDKLKNSTITLTATNNGQYHYYNASTGLGENIPSNLTITASGIDWEDGMEIQWKVPSALTVDKEDLKDIITKGVNPVLSFNIPNVYDSSIGAQVVECVVKNQNGSEATGVIRLDFGYKGSQGTECTFYISLDKEYLEPGKEITATAHFLDEAGKEEKKKVSWSWQNSSPYLSSLDNSSYVSKTDSDYSCVISCTESGAWDNYNGILVATLSNVASDQKITYKAFKSIPLKTGTEVYVGPSTIIYNSQGGNPQYSAVPYSGDATILTNNRNQTCVKIKDNILFASELAPTKFPKITIKIVDYYIPLTIYRNEYSSDILNSWNGNLKVDNNTNQIFAKMIGAGEKNSENQFSGVFMGSVGLKEESASTGLYGYKDGVMRFKFTEKGEGYLGTGSDNCISFEDGKFKVNAKDFTFNSNKLLITSNPDDNGYIFNYNDKLTLDKDGNAFFKGDISGASGTFSGKIEANNGKIAGWEINKNNIGKATGGNQFNLYSEGNNWIYAKGANGEFKVAQNGSLYATNGYFEGEIKATSGEFTGTLKADSIISDNTQIGNTKNYVITTRENGVGFYTKTHDGGLGGGASRAGISLSETDTDGHVFLSAYAAGLNIYTELSMKPSLGVLMGQWRADRFTTGELASGSVVSESIATPSDQTLKNSIETLPSNYINLLYSLNPVRFKYNDGTSDRYHTGFIAQEVAEALENQKMETKDFGGYVGLNKGEDNEYYALRYGEFVALNTAAIQAQKKEIEILKQELNELKEKIK